MVDEPSRWKSRSQDRSLKTIRTFDFRWWHALPPRSGTAHFDTERETMGVLSWLCCCFGRRLTTEDLVDVLKRDGIANIGAAHGVVDMTRKDMTSCNTTAILLGKVIQGKVKAKKGATLEDIKSGIQSRMAVTVCLKPNHWFTLIPESNTSVVMLQSYQDVYTIDEWLNSRNDGDVLKAQLYADLNQILSGPAPDAAVRLFSHGPSSAETVRKDFEVQAEIDTLFTVGSFTYSL